jgi:hypothetical protein
MTANQEGELGQRDNTGESRFPMLDDDVLQSLPKARKPQDMERIYTSPNSEDWVTWNMLRALQRSNADAWWTAVVAAAAADAMSTDWGPLSTPPRVDWWRTVSTPAEYEQASRARMATSDNDEWRTRAENPRSVEGDTEVDLVFEGDDYVIFVEAKLDSDISMSTTYDDERNQIVRNIDCVIEEAAGREPFFWMFVHDRLPTREYEKKLASYREDPSRLHRVLPHRDPAVLDQVVSGMAVIQWSELLDLVADGAEVADVVVELHRRIAEPAS